MMKKFLIILGVLFLLVDLAHDGRIGLEQHVSTLALSRAVLTCQRSLFAQSKTPTHTAECKTVFLSLRLVDHGGLGPSQSLAAVVAPSLKVIKCSPLGSSGGIPL